MKHDRPKNRLINALIQHAIRAEDQFWGALQADLTATGRRPEPFNPEPHNLPRRKGHTLALVVGPEGAGLRWMNTLQLLYIKTPNVVVQVDYTTTDDPAAYCAVRFLPFYDIHAYDRGRKHADS